MPDQVGHDGMVIDQKILDDLTELAKANPRLRQAMDLRNSPEDASQRMLNAIEPGTVMPIHRHKNSSETCVCLRGHFEEYFYDEQGNLTDTIDMVPGGIVLNIEKGWRPTGRWLAFAACGAGSYFPKGTSGSVECGGGPSWQGCSRKVWNKVKC